MAHRFSVRTGLGEQLVAVGSIVDIDHGGVIFIDLRDREGYVRVCIRTLTCSRPLVVRFYVRIKAVRAQRPAGTTNDKPEKAADRVVLVQMRLNASVLLVSAGRRLCVRLTRLTHRVLDLRRRTMQEQPDAAA
jgi:aspartyl-tRNA synthetase